MLRQGVALSEMAVSPLPGNPNAVFTVKKNIADEFDAYIVVSFVNATLVLSIGETVEEVSDSGFLGTTPTLSASLLGDDSLLQAHPGGLRHVRADKRINEWRCPGRKTITRVACNNRQVVIALSGGEIIYFELDSTGQLMEIEKLETNGDVACLHVGPVPEGSLRNRFLAVGSFDSTVRVLSLSADDCLQTMGVQALAAAPCSLLMLQTREGGLYLNVGLANGVLLRAEVDRVTGQLSDTRARFLGARPPKLHGATVRGQPAMLALSSRPWLGRGTKPDRAAQRRRRSWRSEMAVRHRHRATTPRDASSSMPRALRLARSRERRQMARRPGKLCVPCQAPPPCQHTARREPVVLQESSRPR